MRLAASWSGGKDSALAAALAPETGKEVAGLVNVVDPGTGRVRAHGVPAAVIQAQAEAMGLRLEQRAADWEGYEAAFREAAVALRDEGGVEGLVFGDVDVEGHREWGERVADDLGLEALYPLWGWDHGRVVRAAAERGIEALVVSARPPLDASVLGEVVDGELAGEAASRGASPSGEEGSYHTLAVDGPGFVRRLAVRTGAVVDEGDGWRLEVALSDEGAGP